jgi:DNA polymerase-3 subunit gamma/tau
MEENLYRKFRPIQLKDVVGQAVTVNTLKKAATKDKFSHAYLFSGPKGTGKTTMARILATLLTCPDRKPGSTTSCGKCRSCKAIHAGHCVDVMEIDAASNGGVEKVRELKESAYYSPISLNMKVYIIDEAHMLTTQANNALLKILEEPPPYLVFILCTTDPQKLLDTIVSRCQRYVFKKIDPAPMAERLTAVAGRESIQLGEGVALKLAKLAKGSMRDAFGMLEQIAMFSDNNVTIEALNQYYGVPDDGVMGSLVRMVFDKNISGALKTSNDLYSADVRAQAILMEFSNILNDVFHIKVCGADTDLVYADPDERKFLALLSEKVTLGSIIKMVGSLNRIERDISLNLNERLVLDAALVNCILIINVEENQAGNAGAKATSSHVPAKVEA